MEVSEDIQDTRARILHAATRLFGELGYRGATVAAICQEAEANIAAVNYHFGGKDALYVESWRTAFVSSIERHPPDGGVPPTASTEERLGGWIRSMIERVLDPRSHDFEIAHFEFTNPTGLLSEVMRECITPTKVGLQKAISELLGKNSTPEKVQLCMMSLHSQCLNPQILGKRLRKMKREFPQPGPPPLMSDVEEIISHVTSFCLAGIKAMANEKSPGTSRRSRK